MSEIDYKMLGELIRLKRKREGLTMRELATSLGIKSHFAIWRVEHCRGRVYPDHLSRFCGWLGITPARLTGRKFLISTRRQDESTLDVIHHLILSDSKLTGDGKIALFRIMELGYMLATK